MLLRLNVKAQVFKLVQRSNICPLLFILCISGLIPAEGRLRSFLADRLPVILDQWDEPVRD